jgi:hypothetical protein
MTAKPTRSSVERRAQCMVTFPTSRKVHSMTGPESPWPFARHGALEMANTDSPEPNTVNSPN